jgi:hypothetical protein
MDIIKFSKAMFLSEDQNSVIILWILYIVSIVLNLFKCKFFLSYFGIDYPGYAVLCLVLNAEDGGDVFLWNVA